MELAPADAIVLRPQELGGQPAPWLAYWAFYLIVIGIFAHVGAAWLGCKKFIAWWKTLHTPRGYPWTWWKAETSTENYINNTLDSEDEEWEEAWDMDQPRDYLDTYLDWGPASGIRRRSTRPEEPQPEPWRNLLNSTASRERGTEEPSTPNLLDTPSTRTTALEGTSTNRSNSPRSNYSPWRESVRESRDMQWLVTRRLNTKDSWQL